MQPSCNQTGDMEREVYRGGNHILFTVLFTLVFVYLMRVGEPIQNSLTQNEDLCIKSWYCTYMQIGGRHVCNNHKKYYVYILSSPSCGGSVVSWLPSNRRVFRDVSLSTAEGRTRRRLFLRSNQRRLGQEWKRLSGRELKQFPSRYRHCVVGGRKAVNWLAQSGILQVIWSSIPAVDRHLCVDLIVHGHKMKCWMQDITIQYNHWLGVQPNWKCIVHI